MGVHPKYVILGNGRWAGVIHGILAQQRQVVLVDGTRRLDGESDPEYQARIARALTKTGATVAWICVPPSPNTPALTSAAIDSGMSVIAEKPWNWGEEASQLLIAQAHARGVLIGVHYEYCLLDAVEAWRGRWQRGAGLHFSGRYTTSRPDRLGIPALENLGCHLFAIHAYAVPEAAISAIYCGYGEGEERIVMLGGGQRSMTAIDFSSNQEPIIQRYIERFEEGLGGTQFPFTLGFAVEVWEAFRAYGRRHPQP